MQESPLFKPKLDCHKYYDLTDSPKRKADDDGSCTPKKKKKGIGSILIADDRDLTDFEKYINKVNRREWEREVVSSDDEGYVPIRRHFVEEAFWDKLKETIIVYVN